MTPEQAIGSALAAVDRLREYGLGTRRRNRSQAYGAVAMSELRDAGYEVITSKELQRLREVERPEMVRRIHRVAPPRSGQAS